MELARKITAHNMENVSFVKTTIVLKANDNSELKFILEKLKVKVSDLKPCENYKEIDFF